MATLQHLSNRQIDEVIRAAAERQVPATVTIRVESGWANIRARLIDIRNGHVWLELPDSANGEAIPSFQPADKAGVSFKLKHHKHIFTGTVAGTETARLADGRDARVLSVCSPTKMHRMQRRAFLRVPVPANRVVRASFWMGGCESEPATGSPEHPIWTGRVVNISAGGFQVLSEDGAGEALDIGETVGVRISFGAGEQTAFADAQFRHHQIVDGDVHVGFQFVGLTQSTQGRRILQMMGDRASRFHRENTAAERAHR